MIRKCRIFSPIRIPGKNMVKWQKLTIIFDKKAGPLHNKSDTGNEIKTTHAVTLVLNS